MVNIKTLPDRIIFDGHADTAKECETITLMCDGLACNDNFRTVAYRKGYAEFEKVGVAKELKFVPNVTLIIYSNDGSTQVGSVGTDYDGFSVNATGITGNFGEQMYTYSGTKTFLGVALTSKATIPTYAVGTTFGTDWTGEHTVYIVEGGGSSMINVDLTTLTGYESLPAGTYALGVKAKAANYQDSDLSSTVSFTKLAAPVATASDTTVTWEAIDNAESYDVYVDGELYENVTGGGVTPETYTVAIPGNTHGDSGYGFYSIDDGVTWVDLFKSEATTVNAKTIKFKAKGDEWWNCAIDSQTIGVSIAPYHTEETSDNYTLTQNVNDLTVVYGAQ